MLQPRSYKIYLNENTIAISKRQVWPSSHLNSNQENPNLKFLHLNN